MTINWVSNTINHHSWLSACMKHCCMSNCSIEAWLWSKYYHLRKNDSEKSSSKWGTAQRKKPDFGLGAVRKNGPCGWKIDFKTMKNRPKIDFSDHPQKEYNTRSLKKWLHIIIQMLSLKERHSQKDKLFVLPPIRSLNLIKLLSIWKFWSENSSWIQGTVERKILILGWWPSKSKIDKKSILRLWKID